MMTGSTDVRPLMAYIEKVDAELKQLKRELEAERAAPKPDAVTALRRAVVDSAVEADVVFAGLIELRDRLKSEDASEAATRKAHNMAMRCMEVSKALRGALS